MAELRHPLRRMTGRDPDEEGRAATGLELLFDLTFVIAFGLAGSAASHMFAQGHVGPAIVGFSFAMFAICWAWVNFAWFASAYDTDDWLYRLTTMVQMVGVLVLAIGLPAMFASLEHEDHLDNRTMVFGYVIMRVAMIAQWVRASKEHVERRETCRRYALLIAIAQVLWVVIAIFDMPILPAFALITVGGIFELMIPAIAERKGRTPWHPHHIAERYFLLTIIALGEVLVGTVTTLSSDVEANGWSFGTALCGFGGVAITFGLWWAYGLLPSGEILASRTENSYLWGYLHIVLFGSVAATGAGLHVAAYYLAGEASIPEWLAVLAVAVPVAVFLITIMVIYNVLLPADVPHIVRTLAVMVLLGVAVWLATFGVPVSWCIVVIALVPAVLIAIDEVSAADARIDRLQRLTYPDGVGLALCRSGCGTDVGAIGPTSAPEPDAAFLNSMARRSLAMRMNRWKCSFVHLNDHAEVNSPGESGNFV